MEKFVKEMIEEHAQLVNRIDKLDKFLNCCCPGEFPKYKDKPKDVSDDEFIKLVLQRKCMIDYCDILKARLEINGIFYDTFDKEYFEKVAKNKETYEEKS